MKKVRILVAVLGAWSLSACASIIDGSSQQISIESTPPGAQCALLREGAPIGSTTTPGGMTVKKTKHPIQVKCTKDGYEESVVTLKSEIQGSTFGNIILGGGIGWAIDSASGADNKYQEYVTVAMVPKIAGAGGAVVPVAAPAATAGSWRTTGASATGYAESGGKGAAVAIASNIPLEYVEQNGDGMLFKYASMGGGQGQAWLRKADVVKQ